MRIRTEAITGWYRCLRGLALWTVERRLLPSVLGEHHAACARMVGPKGDDAPAWRLRWDIT